MLKERAQAIAQTVNTPGWSYLKEHMNAVLLRAQEDMIDMEDSAKAEQVRMGLKYTRQFRDAFFDRAEALANYTEEAVESMSDMSFEGMLTEKAKELKDAARTASN